MRSSEKIAKSVFLILGIILPTTGAIPIIVGAGLALIGALFTFVGIKFKKSYDVKELYIEQ